MGKRMSVQIPADVTCLVRLLYRLSYRPGPLRAFRVRKNAVLDVWFTPDDGCPIKRARAVMGRGDYVGEYARPRRVYVGLHVQRTDGAWHEISDEEYRSIGLDPPWEYAGLRYISVIADPETGQAEWLDEGPNPDHEMVELLIPYHAYLGGDREKAIAVAKDEIADILSMPRRSLLPESIQVLDADDEEIPVTIEWEPETPPPLDLDFDELIASLRVVQDGA